MPAPANQSTVTASEIPNTTAAPPAVTDNGEAGSQARQGTYAPETQSMWSGPAEKTFQFRLGWVVVSTDLMPFREHVDLALIDAVAVASTGSAPVAGSWTGGGSITPISSGGGTGNPIQVASANNPTSPLGPQSVTDARWVGNGASDAWTDNNNWQGGSGFNPTATATTNTYYGDVGGSRKFTDMSGYGAYFFTGHFYFDATGSQFNLGGTNTANNFVRIFGGVENGPTYVNAATAQPTQTFSATIALGANSSFIARNGDLVMNSANIYGNSFTLSLNSGGNSGRTITFNGVLQDGSDNGGGLSLNIDTVKVVFAATNLYTGDTILNSGTLQLGTTGSATGSANSSTIRLGAISGTGSDASINLATTAGGQAISDTINPRAGATGTYTLSLNSQNTANANTYSGHIGLDHDFTITQSAGGTLNITQARAGGAGTTTGYDIKGFTATFTPAATGTISVSGDIYNSVNNGSVILNGAGNLILSGTNTFTGSTTINNGVLSAAAANALGSTGNNPANAGITVNSGGTLLLSGSSGVTDRINSSNSAVFTLNGGTFNTGGLSEHGASNNTPGIGPLSLLSTSIIDMANGASIIAFANSNNLLRVLTWSGTLKIYDWTGTPITGAGTDQLYFGSDATGLSVSQLQQIQFYSGAGTGAYNAGAIILSTGEVVPVPEPATWLAATFAIGAVGCLRRRQIRK